MKVRSFSVVQDVLGERQGWRRGDGDVIVQHAKLGTVHHVAICKDDGTPMYDQPLHAEPVGAVTVPVNRAGELRTVTVWRPTVRSAGLYRYPDLDLETLGVDSIEFPRGFPWKGERPADTARREASEELQSPILSVDGLGEITPNTTFNPHRIPVFFVHVDEGFAGTMPPDVNEKILAVQCARPMIFAGSLRRGASTAGLRRPRSASTSRESECGFSKPGNGSRTYGVMCRPLGQPSGLSVARE